MSATGTATPSAAVSASSASPQSHPQLQPQRTPATRSRSALWRDIFRLLKQFWLAQPLASSALLVLMLVGNARTGLYVIAMRGLVDSLSSFTGLGEGHRPIYWLVLYLAATAIEQVYWVVQPTLQAYLRDHGSYRIQESVLQRAAAAPLVRFDEPVFFDQLQRANAGMGERLVGLYTSLAEFLRSFVMLGSVAVSLYLVHPLLLPLLVAGSLPAVWFQARISNAVYELQRSHTTRDRIRGYLQWLLTAKDAASELRLFGLSDYLLGRWHALREERRQDVLATEGRRNLYSTAGNVIATAAYAGGLVLVAVLIFRRQLSIGDYVAVTTGALWFQGMVGDVIFGVRSLAEEAQFLGDLFEYMNVTESQAPPRSSSGQRGMVSPSEATSASLPATKPARSSGLRVDAETISFRYPGNAVAVVHDVTLHIRAGERVAIVGENGAGKTTLIKLLIGLYQPETGVVRVNGEPLTLECAAAVQRRVAVVFQDYATFPLTARENIGFGDIPRMNDEAALARAAEQAGIREMIESLPEKYDTYLGRQFGSTDLSGGQWQKIALARAFMRDAELVVLDEPTAAMDPLAELALFERFIELVGHRTAIMISHRLGAARLADRVIVLRDGTVAEEGSHDELVARGGEYARLFQAQAQWYR